MRKYKTILIDPPWDVEAIAMKRRPNSITIPYKTMTTEEIEALPIKDLSAAESNIFLWTTHTYLEDALALLRTWGFKYHCVITWDKGNGYSVCGFTRRTELVLYGYRGKMGVNQRGKFIPTLMRDMPDLFDEKRTAHSRKPMKLYRWLERNAPEPRLEMFARAKRAGWDCWGNEIVSDVNIETVATMSNAPSSFRQVETLVRQCEREKDMVSKILWELKQNNVDGAMDLCKHFLTIDWTRASA